MKSYHTPSLAQQGRILCHHHRISSMVTAWLHEGEGVFLQKLGSTAAAKALRWTSRRQGVRWRATATHHWWSKGEMLLERGRWYSCGSATAKVLRREHGLWAGTLVGGYRNPPLDSSGAGRVLEDQGQPKMQKCHGIDGVQ